MSDDFAPKSEFLATLIARGFVHQCTDFGALDAEARKGGLSAYIGFDCTAPSLHIGSLLPIMLLAWLQRTGGKPLPLVGGGTTRVGDPSGKDESRKLLTIEQIDANKASIKTIFEKFLRFGEGAGDALLLDNADWLAGSELHRVSARRGPAFFGQPHADDGQRKAAPRARARAILHRIQLYVSASL